MKMREREKEKKDVDLLIVALRNRNNSTLSHTRSQLFTSWRATKSSNESDGCRGSPWHHVESGDGRSRLTAHRHWSSSSRIPRSHRHSTRTASPRSLGWAWPSSLRAFFHSLPCSSSAGHWYSFLSSLQQFWCPGRAAQLSTTHSAGHLHQPM